MKRKHVCSYDESPPHSVFTWVHMYEQNWALKRIETGQSITGQSEKALPHLYQVAGEDRKEVAQGEGYSVCKKFQLSEEMKHRACFSKISTRHENRVSLIGKNPLFLQLLHL